jgi:hypothetical protein
MAGEHIVGVGMMIAISDRPAGHCDAAHKCQVMGQPGSFRKILAEENTGG